MKKIVGTIALAFALATPAQGQWSMDQSSSTLWFNYSNPDPWIAQTFTPTVNNITGITAGMGEFAGRFCDTQDPSCPLTYSIYLSLWSGAPDQQTSQMLAGSTVTYANLGDYSHAELWFNPISITAGQTYWIVMGMPSSPSVSWWSHVIDPYANGQACWGGAQIGDTWNCYEGTTLDYDFATFFDPTIAPEPSTWILLASGLAAMIVLRRRRA